MLTIRNPTRPTRIAVSATSPATLYTRTIDGWSAIQNRGRLDRGCISMVLTVYAAGNCAWDLARATAGAGSPTRISAVIASRIGSTGSGAVSSWLRVSQLAV